MPENIIREAPLAVRLMLGAFVNYIIRSEQQHTATIGEYHSCTAEKGSVVAELGYNGRFAEPCDTANFFTITVAFRHIGGNPFEKYSYRVIWKLVIVAGPLYFNPEIVWKVRRDDEDDPWGYWYVFTPLS